MSYLPNDISNISSEVSRVLREAQLHTDLDLRSLTRQDLNELFPGPKRLQLRKTIFDKIHKQKQIDVHMRELKDFIHESSRAALTNNGVLADNLYILRDMKTQMNHIHSFLDTHIDHLEQLSKNQPEQKSDKDKSDTSGQGVANTVQTGVHPQRSQNSFSGAGTSYMGHQLVNNSGPTVPLPPREQTIVTYQTAVKGKTFGAERQLMEKVISFDQDMVRFEDSDNGQILIVFCPISSRVISDVEAAMQDVKDDKPVILVLMHHSRQPTNVKILWQHPKVVLLVSVFYHDTISGLLRCEENNDAVFKIQKKLREYSPLRSQDTSGNASGVSSTVGCTITTSNASGGDNRISKTGSRHNYFNWSWR
ncbi:uncharacterized protein [Pempheris klunzingeri]|uniref:uncharacterized protein n=1 Tax=Pempheris klunzingeri TaxID=3127111 RepID=UPI0039818FB3